MQDNDPFVQFNKPFQSGEGMCNPIYPWNYYNIKKGGKSNQSNKVKKGGSDTKPCDQSISYSNGMKCPGVNNLDLNTRKYFGPFLYPPVPFTTTQSGGKNKKISKKNHKGGFLVGPEYLNQPFLSTKPSKPSDLDYNGSFTDTNPRWKQALTGSGIQATKKTVDLSKNYGVSYATAAGGTKTTKKKVIKKKPPTKKVVKKKSSGKKVIKKKSSTKKVVKRKSSGKKVGKKQKGGDSNFGATFMPAKYYNPNSPLPSGAGCTDSAYGPINAVSGACRNLAPCPNSSGIQTGGIKKRVRSIKNKKGGSSNNSPGGPPGYEPSTLEQVLHPAPYSGGSKRRGRPKKNKTGGSSGMINTFKTNGVTNVKSPSGYSPSTLENNILHPAKYSGGAKTKKKSTKSTKSTKPKKPKKSTKSKKINKIK